MRFAKKNPQNEGLYSICAHWCIFYCMHIFACLLQDSVLNFHQFCSNALLYITVLSWWNEHLLFSPPIDCINTWFRKRTGGRISTSSRTYPTPDGPACVTTRREQYTGMSSYEWVNKGVRVRLFVLIFSSFSKLAIRVNV